MSESLTSTEVLVLDCQSTGANPERGSLLELGWSRARAVEGGRAGEITARLVTLPEGEEIPVRIARLTGINGQTLVDAVAPEAAWTQLCAASATPGDGPVLAVAHVARFEEAFLRDLHHRHGDGPFPFDLICSHQIAKRLLPELPRRGLHALAGYFGFSIGALKRAAEHVEATAFVWWHLVRRLTEETEVRTVEDLRRWLAEDAPRVVVARRYPLPRAERLALPAVPGVYRYWRTNGDLLYVGKATDLKRRVNSYFQKRRGVSERQLEMLTQAHRVTHTVTDTVLEAALLESDEIKRRQPPYNVALRRGERRLWFADPRLTEVGERAIPGGIGPVPSRETLAALSALCSILRHDRLDSVTERECAVALGVPERWAPEPDCFGQGWALFESAHLGAANGSAARRLLGLGATLWALRRAAEEQADEVEEAEAGEAAEEERADTWDPERVQRAIESVLVRAGLLIRRARWLCRLSEASVSWSLPGEGRRLLVLDGGIIVERRTLLPSESLPAPPGWPRRHHDRQDCLDLETYDRLRVLTTELRRLLDAPRDVVIHLGGDTVLGPSALRRLLRWI